jgi:hypothetical protein
LVAETGVPVTAVARGLLFRLLTTGERAFRGELSGLEVLEAGHRYDLAAAALGI